MNDPRHPAFRPPPLRSGGGSGWERRRQHENPRERVWRSRRNHSWVGPHAARIVAPPPQPSPVARGRGSDDKRLSCSFPYLTAVLSTLAVAAIVLPDLGDAWQLDRNSIGAGEAWRLATCHLSHWSTDHFVWDVLTFAVLGALCETWSRPRFTFATITGGLAISASVWFGIPDVHAYRGLSGIDCSLFALLATLLIRERRGTPAAVTGSLLLAAAFLKVTYELATGTALFVDTAAGLAPLPLAHVAGGLSGIAVGAWPKKPAATTLKSATMRGVGIGADSNEGRADISLPLSMRWPRGFLE